MTTRMQRLELQVEPGVVRRRLDEYLFARVEQLSRMYLRELVKTGRVQVNGEPTNTGVRISSNDLIEIEADLSRGTAMRPEPIPLDIIFEDDHIIVVNKPAGMLVHPTHRDKNGTMLNALSHHLNRRDGDTEGFVRPGLVHRLDRETSGLIVVAKSSAAHRRLAAGFMKKRVEKRYLALVEGVVDADTGTIELPIGRLADEKRWDVKTDGKVSVTRFRARQRFEDRTLIELEPVTGRTNQLRIHCAAIGHPIVGDTRRGGRAHRRLCLHAEKLTLTHPVDGNRLTFVSEALDLRI